MRIYSFSSLTLYFTTADAAAILCYVKHLADPGQYFCYNTGIIGKYYLSISGKVHIFPEKELFAEKSTRMAGTCFPILGVCSEPGDYRPPLLHLKDLKALPVKGFSPEGCYDRVYPRNTFYH